ncbi:hypothetical protein MYCTH_2303310 [Thermothelomyces thermophilus ATCC 42464]|uniref:Uncharacterized protein n=1 Tax=Thermothelomyces thermophilus (strain ATCC 42464 / BCRC 31852 / DSM 1799) TaxID=573729 RepID=G2QCD4_THET4|nr:uncharacterized protein MYCTH_2303310 [Thermothelomyces thermophilus ATCC 42464]AEO57309.1 hypothetical protein MYCTH_2303310 [Thermothelomyces thermophilus ATCC 42464]
MAPTTITLAPPYVKTFRKKPYPAVSPSRPELSQSGRTVLVAGASSGIGFAIARAFVHASASHVILTGRREAVLADAVSRLKTEAKDGTTISGFVSDVSDPRDSEKLWSGIGAQGIVVDVLVLNAMNMGQGGPLLQAELGATWKAFETNVRGFLDYAQRFSKQGEGRPKFLINVSTSCIHNCTTEGSGIPTYALSKNAGTLLMQLIADDTDPEHMQVVSFHPGSILSDTVRSAGFDETSKDWDDVNLSGQFAVFCASEEARFLHGRFVPIWWDVDELKAGEARARMESDYHFLRLGLVGV